MHKRKIILISAVVVVVVLIAGVIGSVAYAQSTTPTATPAVKTLMARVAEKLGIDQAKLETAFKEAQQEMRDEAMDARLQKMVEAGKLTQEQADEYKDWINSRPDVPAGLDAKGPMGFRGGPCFPKMGGAPFFPGKVPPAPTK
jgi:outer membrane murein-binding lipoprotein Lpp